MNSEIDSTETGNTERHSEVENEVQSEVSDPLLNAKMYEEKLLGNFEASEADLNR